MIILYEMLYKVVVGRFFIKALFGKLWHCGNSHLWGSVRICWTRLTTGGSDAGCSFIRFGRLLGFFSCTFPQRGAIVVISHYPYKYIQAMMIRQSSLYATPARLWKSDLRYPMITLALLSRNMPV